MVRMSIDAIEIEQARERIGTTAREMLADDCSYIEGSRQIVALLHRARIDQFTQPFVVFVAIDSETDAVPIGELREGWHPEAKIKLQPEWDEAENYAKTYGQSACREAIAWVQQHPSYGS